MNKLMASMSLIIIANIIVWFQFQGHFWSNKLIWKSPYFIMLAGAIISPMFWYATKFGYEGFGALWPVRFIGFATSMISFPIMTWLYLGEVITLKTIITIILAIIIMLLQLI